MGAWVVLGAEGLLLSSPWRWGLSQGSRTVIPPHLNPQPQFHVCFVRSISELELDSRDRASEMPRGSWESGEKALSTLTGFPSCPTAHATGPQSPCSRLFCA